MKKIKFNKLISLFLLVVISMFIYNINLIYANNIIKNIQITAHRGSSIFYPDNTFASIDEAILENTDYVEIDLRITKDNQVVVFHDNNLKRVDNSNLKIEDMTLEEVKKIDNGSYKNKLFSKEKIPTLEELLKRYKNKVKFNFHLKVRDKDRVLPKEVSKLIDKYDMNSDVIITCSKKEIIENYKKENPKSKTGLIVGKNIEKIENTNCDLISIKYDLLSKELVQKLHKNNKEVHVWTINNIDKISHAIDLNVDNIITNDVILAKGILNYKSNK